MWRTDNGRAALLDGLCGGAVAEGAEVGEALPNPVLGFLPDRASVEQDDVGRARLLLPLISARLEHGLHHLAVVDVHLAAVRFHVHLLLLGIRLVATDCIPLLQPVHLPRRPTALVRLDYLHARMRASICEWFPPAAAPWHPSRPRNGTIHCPCFCRHGLHTHDGNCRTAYEISYISDEITCVRLAITKPMNHQWCALGWKKQV